MSSTAEIARRAFTEQQRPLTEARGSAAEFLSTGADAAVKGLRLRVDTLEAAIKASKADWDGEAGSAKKVVAQIVPSLDRFQKAAADILKQAKKAK